MELTFTKIVKNTGGTSLGEYGDLRLGYCRCEINIGHLNGVVRQAFGLYESGLESSGLQVYEKKPEYIMEFKAMP